jgi:flagellar biosynthesis/type III secretory pathway protein FliH
MTFSTLAQLPNKDGKLTLKLNPDDVDRAAHAVDKLNKDIGEFKASLPPAQISVSTLFDQSEDETKELKD